jgi:hypothetical protein
VGYEICINRRKELLPLVFGCLFFQISNWVLRFCVSKEPLFVNTSVFLLHSSLTSTSGNFNSNSLSYLGSIFASLELFNFAIFLFDCNAS